MQLDYFFFYTEANLVCIIILGILLIHSCLNSTRQEKLIWYSRTLATHILYFLSDIGWAAVLSGNLPRTRLLVVLFNFLNYFLLSLIAYEWFMYTAASIRMKSRNSSKFRILWLLPMVLSILAVVLLFIISPETLVRESNELTNLYYPMMIAAPIIYLVTAQSLSLNRARRAESKEDAQQFLQIGLYPICILGFGLIQTFAMNAPLFCFGCTVVMMIFYIRNLQVLVSVDSLTRLNNRGQISRYMQQVRFRENIRSYAVMIDIDNFKKINDTFGHAEGDRALMLVSDVLKQAVERIRSAVFLGRYGGDEFTIFLQCAEGDVPPDQLLATIREMLEERQAETDLPYVLKISAGYDLLRDRKDTLAACLNRADEKLYQNKRAANVGR